MGIFETADTVFALSLLLFPIAAIGLLVLVAIVISRQVGKAAERKGRNRRTFFWLSLLLFPSGTLIVGIVVASVTPYCARCGTPGWATKDGYPDQSCSGCADERSVGVPSAVTRRDAMREWSNPPSNSGVSDTLGNPLS